MDTLTKSLVSAILYIVAHGPLALQIVLTMKLAKLFVPLSRAGLEEGNMIEIREKKFLGSMCLAGYNGIWLDEDDQDEQRDQLYAQILGWA